MFTVISDDEHTKHTVSWSSQLSLVTRGENIVYSL